MITSITAATIAATSAVAGWGVVLGAGGAILVIGLLVSLELLGGTHHPNGVVLQRLLHVSTIPLVAVFAVSVTVKALTILGEAA